jgi:hypothetical protein
MASSTCAFCDKAASRKCTGCKTYVYCGKECQSSDWRKHKIICKDVLLSQALERAAGIIHQAFLGFSENTWDTPIVKIEDKEDELVIYDGVASQRPTQFIDFPHHLIKNDRVKMAVLCMLKCNEPLAWMHNMFVELTKG